MEAEEKLKELSDCISALTVYYMNVLSEENTEHKRVYIEGKLNALRDIRQKLNKLDKK